MSAEHEAIKASEWTEGNTEFVAASQIEPYGALLVTIAGTSRRKAPPGSREKIVKAIQFEGWSKAVLVGAR